MDLASLLPAPLRAAAPTFSPIAAGLSGAAVHRVEAAGRSYVLKIASAEEPREEWRRGVDVQRRAAEAGVTPHVVHVDEDARAVLTDFVEDRSFFAFYATPATHAAALDSLGRLVARIHALPIVPGTPRRDPQRLLAEIRTELVENFALPAFVDDAMKRALAAPLPDDRPVVLAHNDLNPSNLLYDGRAILALDWAAAGPNDPRYDLAVLALFLRMDEAATRRLLAAYGDPAPEAIPAAFSAYRRFATTLAATFQLRLARRLGHRGGADVDPERAPSLGDFYQGLRTGSQRLGTAEGQWAFGLALFKEAIAA